jgi:hypothetical protein
VCTFQDEEHDLTTNQVDVCNLALLYEVALLSVHLGAPFLTLIKSL